MVHSNLVWVALAGSSVLSLLLLSMYIRFYRKRTANVKGQASNSSLQQIRSRSSFADLGTGLTRRMSVLANHRGIADSTRKRLAVVPAADQWGKLRTLGIDLGSFMVKVCLYHQSEVHPKEGVRPIAMLTPQGLLFGDPTCAEHPEISFLSLITDLAQHPMRSRTCCDVEFTVAHTVGGLLQHINTRNPGCSIIGASFPPYLASAARIFYVSMYAAELNRCLLFTQSAALIASLLWLRTTTVSAKAKPLRNVVFVDLGHSGVSAYVCEVRESSGSVMFTSYKSEGVSKSSEAVLQHFRRQIPLHTAINGTPTTDSHPDEYHHHDGAGGGATASGMSGGGAGGGGGLDGLFDVAGNPIGRPDPLGRLSSVLHEVADEFANTPTYLAASAATRASRQVGSHSVEITRPEYLELTTGTLSDVESVLAEVKEFARLRSILLEETELVMSGSGFKIPEFRRPWEACFQKRYTNYERVSIVQGLSILAAMTHPLYTAQKFDIYPLFELPTVDESGSREAYEQSVIERSQRGAGEQGQGSSVFTPLLPPQRSSSSLGPRRKPSRLS